MSLLDVMVQSILIFFVFSVMVIVVKCSVVVYCGRPHSA